MARYGWKSIRPIKDIAVSEELEKVLMRLAEPVLASAETDPNPDYVESLRLRAFRSGGRRGRVSANVTAAPFIGSAVEAKRGTLGRAISRAGE
ncbi:hypothetical protein NS183_07770 [Microbacterium testaceum]|uniref:hypothetical protein n=1 Tax=Microbacterium testaceum TaxID=2033 RepID=UPI000734C55E|nr:hypothetical protein [Microbacterium testaceum]KTS90675.1 hypothetical protein NS183_07770 [Microbacterium testaceum]